MNTNTKKKTALAVLGAAAVLMGAAVWFFVTYTWVDGQLYRKDLAHLDLSGTAISQLEALDGFQHLQTLDLQATGLTPEQFALLQQRHPDCQIRWDVPFQGKCLDSHSETITISSLTEDDVAALAYFPLLKEIVAEGCSDYFPLAQLQRQYPGIAVSYEVPIGGEAWPQDTRQMSLTDADGKALLEQLAWLPQLESVQLLGKLPAPAQMEALYEAYPALDISWTLELGSQTLNRDTQILELSGWQPESVDALEDLAGYAPGLQRLVILNSGLSHEELQAFRIRHPSLEVVWEIEIEGRVFRTDITEMDLSRLPLTDVSQAEKWFPYFPKLTRVDMSRCGLPYEELDALNQRHENIRVVWTVLVSPIVEIPTDATEFMPYKLNAYVTTESLKNLKYCTDMVCIDIGHMTVRSCEWARYMPNLKYLVIADTQIQSLEPLRGLQNLMYLETFLTNVHDYSPLLDCPNLVDVNICNTSGDITVLAEMTWLERLWIHPNDPIVSRYAPEIQLLREALPGTQIVYSPFSTGEGWRDHPHYFEMRDILGMFYME